LNILFIISSLNHGGAEKQTVIDANLFAEENNVFLVTFKSGELKELLSSKVKLIVLEKKGYLKTAKKIRRIIEDEKIQTVNASLFASMIISVIAANKINIPVIWYFHSHEYDVKLKSKIAFKHFSKYNCLKKIFFVSNELKLSFEKNNYKFPLYKQEVLYNTFTVSIKKKNNFKKHSSIVTIGYIGRLVDLKRVEYLIEVADYLKKNGIMDFCINIVGDGKLRENLIDYSRKNNVDDKINFAGYQSDVEKYYDNFEIFVLPSREECLSIALIDACVKSIPCIAFDVGGNREIIVNGETGYLVSGKNELFEKIKILIGDKNKRKILGEKANKFCLDKFDTVKRLKYLDNVFNNLN
jgi:L-malate glycosyltransferase